MQFPPPPPMVAPLVPPQATHVPKVDMQQHPFNSLIVPQTQQSINMATATSTTTIMQPQTNGIIPQQHGNSQPTILMSPMMTTKSAQNHQQQLQHQHQQQYHHQKQQQQYQQLQQQLQQSVSAANLGQQLSQAPMLVAQQAPAPHQQQLHQQHHHQLQQQQQVQVPMTTIMIPATAAAQIQSASIQIQQAAVQAMSNNPGQQPQILVFMIPYPVPGQQQLPPTIPPTSDQASLNSTLVRQSQSQASIIRASQQQQQSMAAAAAAVANASSGANPATAPSQQQQQPQQQSTHHNRAVSSLSSTNQAHGSKHEPEFYIKANFAYQATRNGHKNVTLLSFQKGDILHVLNTLQNSQYGHAYWLATRVESNGKDAEKGLIPDKNKAEEIALEQRTLDIGEPGGTLDGSSGSVLSASVGRVNFLKRRAAQRSKSLCKDNWDNVVFDIGSFKLPVYERVVFKHPGFCRPVVIFGPLADVAREKLLLDYPGKYSYPSGFNQGPQDHPKVIRLKGILEVVDQGKHALLDITPSAVEKLNHVNLAPIVIFMKTDSKSIIKEFRSRAAESLDPNARDDDTLRRDGKSSRKLLEQSVKLEKMWHHVFTATLDLSTMGSEQWYRKLRETIENQQSVNVWMCERKSDKKLQQQITSPSSSGNFGTQCNNNQINANGNDIGNGSEMTFLMNDTQSTYSCAGPRSGPGGAIDNSSNLSERFNESLNLTSKSTIDLLPDGTYGNRSQLRNAYAHSLAQKLARASSEPKLNGGLMSGGDDHNHHHHHHHHQNYHHQDDIDDEDDGDRDDDDDDDDEIIKKPFPSEFENSSSVSSSNGCGGGGTSFGLGSMTSASNLTYQHYPPPQTMKSEQGLNRALESVIYSRNPMMANTSSYASSNGNTASSNSNYHQLPPMANNNDNGYPNHSIRSISSSNHSTNNINNSTNSANNNNTNNSNKNVIDLSINHDTRGSAFQVYSDINQNNYHYYNLNKI